MARLVPARARSPTSRRSAARLTDVGFIVEGTEGEGADAVLEVELTANRPDGMNHRGLAREAAGALGPRVPRTRPPRRPPRAPADAASLATVTIEEPALCSRYSARVIEGIRVREASAAGRRSASRRSG